MPTIELLNTTEMLIVLADNSGNFGSVQPKSILAVDDSIISKDCVASPIRKGWLKIRQGGKFVGKGAGGKQVAKAQAEKPVPAGKSTEPVNFFPPNPDLDGNSQAAVTFDFKAAEDKRLKDNETENLGQKIVKKGGKRGKKKLVNVDVQKGGPRRVMDIPERVAKGLPNVPVKIIEMEGDGISGISENARIIIPSAIPGAAQLVDLESMGWDNIVRLSNATNQLVDSLVVDRKATMYSNQSKTEKAKVIAATKDLSLLTQWSEHEVDGALLKLIEKRKKEIEG